MGVTESTNQASEKPATPKLAFVSRSQEYLTTQGTVVSQYEMSLCARIFSMGKLHHAYTGTGAIAASVAAKIPGTLVSSVLDEASSTDDLLQIGHSAGIIETSASVEKIDSYWIAHSASIIRTARSLMRGEILIAPP